MNIFFRICSTLFRDGGVRLFRARLSASRGNNLDPFTRRRLGMKQCRICETPCDVVSAIAVCNECETQATSCRTWLTKTGRPKKHGFHKDVGEWVTLRATRFSQSSDDVRLQALLEPWNHFGRSSDRPEGDWYGVYAGFIPSLVLSLYFQVKEDEKFLRSLTDVEAAFSEYAKVNIFKDDPSDEVVTDNLVFIHPFRIDIWSRLFSMNGLDLTDILEKSFEEHRVPHVAFSDVVQRCSMRFCEEIFRRHGGKPAGYIPASSAKYIGTFWPGGYVENILKESLSDFVQRLEDIKGKNPVHLEGFKQTPNSHTRSAQKRKPTKRRRVFDGTDDRGGFLLDDIPNDTIDDTILGSLNSQGSPFNLQSALRTLPDNHTTITSTRVKREPHEQQQHILGVDGFRDQPPTRTTGAFESPSREHITNGVQPRSPNMATPQSINPATEQQSGPPALSSSTVRNFSDLLERLGFFAWGSLKPRLRFVSDSVQYSFVERHRALLRREEPVRSGSLGDQVQVVLWKCMMGDQDIRTWYDTKKGLEQEEIYEQLIERFCVPV